MRLWRRLSFLLRRSRLERELREEMDWHLDLRTREMVDAGLDEPRAREAALRMFGNSLHQREESRDWWGFTWLDLLLQDIRHAGRVLVRQPLLSSIAAVSLGASMAAACAVFSLANTTLLASLPVPDPSALVVLGWASGPTVPYESLDGWSSGNDRENSSTSFSVDAFRAARSAAGGRAEVFAFADLYQVNVTEHGQSDVASGQLVSGNYFSTLGVRPSLGRFITPADDRADAPEPAAVISHAFWRHRFGGRPDIVGTTILVNRVPTVIIGVAPPGFEGTRQVGQTSAISVPLMLRERFVRRADHSPGQSADDELKPLDPRYWWVIIMARVASTTDRAPLQRDVERAIRSTVDPSRTGAAAREPFRVTLEAGGRGMREIRAELVQPLAIMAVIVGVVIVIACANLATLLLARGAARDREMAVRHALGASRARLIRSSMLESLMIGLAGGVLGLAGTRWIADALAPALQLGPGAAIDGPAIGLVAAFAFGGAVLTSLFFGLLPALRGTDVRAMRAIKDGTGRVTSGVPRLRTARGVLVFQVAMSLVVIVAAGLLIGTLRNLQGLQPGFDPAGVLLFRVDPALNGYPAAERRRMLAEILERVRSLPGVRAASFSQHALLSNSSSISTLRNVDGVKRAQPLMVNRLIVGPQFLETMRIRLLAGTARLDAADPAALLRPVIVSRTFARRAFGTTTALGHRFRFSDAADKPAYQVVGVAEDVRVARLRESPPPTIYSSYLQDSFGAASFAVRSALPTAAMLPAVRQAVAAAVPDLAIDRVVTQADQIAAGIEREALFATLASALGALALFLACIGIYGLMAYAVSRRTTEIGVRLALGAPPQRILWMVAGEAGRIIGIGAMFGLAGGVLASRYLDSVLFGLKPTDLVVQGLGVVLLILVAGAAAIIPARRAARTDPLAALRHE